MGAQSYATFHPIARSASVSSGSTPNHQAALTTDRDRHLAADEEDEASEHRLLADVGLAGDQLTNPVGEIFVVGDVADAGSPRCPCRNESRPAKSPVPRPLPDLVLSWPVRAT
jgi:hypothetical protein